MEVQQIPLDEIHVSEFNTRKDLADGQFDSTIEDLARSIEQQGLLQPITIYKKPDGRYALVAGQRRLLAHRFLGSATIDALVREQMTEEDATAVSLVENVHRAEVIELPPGVENQALAARDVDEQSGLSAKTATYPDRSTRAPITTSTSA